MLRSCGVRKSKCLIVRCLRVKVILKPVLSWATWVTAEAVGSIYGIPCEIRAPNTGS
jgi:hypothetical protein